MNKSQLSHSYNINNRLSHYNMRLKVDSSMVFFFIFFILLNTPTKPCNPRKKFSFCKKNVTIINLKIAGRYLLKKEEIVSRLPLMSLMWIQLNTLKYIGISIKLSLRFYTELTWSKPNIQMLGIRNVFVTFVCT